MQAEQCCCTVNHAEGCQSPRSLSCSHGLRSGWEQTFSFIFLSFRATLSATRSMLAYKLLSTSSALTCNQRVLTGLS